LIPYLIDTDAFLWLRKLGVPGKNSILDKLAESIARHELNLIQEEIKQLEDRGQVRVEAIFANTPEYSTFKALRRDVHKGEAEAIAWALHSDPRPLFVSGDGQAIKAALKRSVPATDVMGFIVECVETGAISREFAASALEQWSDHEQRIGRPKDYDGFAATYKCRLARGRYCY
jgi:predicted nucleic acid-binding protein